MPKIIYNHFPTLKKEDNTLQALELTTSCTKYNTVTNQFMIFFL